MCYCVIWREHLVTVPCWLLIQLWAEINLVVSENGMLVRNITFLNQRLIKYMSLEYSGKETVLSGEELNAVKPEYFHKWEELFPKIQCVSVYFKCICCYNIRLCLCNFHNYDYCCSWKYVYTKSRLFDIWSPVFFSKVGYIWKENMKPVQGEILVG
jgi:hypothetical protein